jgi:hypothetical protein
MSLVDVASAPMGRGRRMDLAIPGAARTTNARTLDGAARMAQTGSRATVLRGWDGGWSRAVPDVPSGPLNAVSVS